MVDGITLPWNFGVIEGHVNRIKMLRDHRDLCPYCCRGPNRAYPRGP
ncbi:hypothetical protein ABZ958_34170 [Streptomyces sp. NPDC046237]